MPPRTQAGKLVAHSPSRARDEEMVLWKSIRCPKRSRNPDRCPYNPVAGQHLPAATHSFQSAWLCAHWETRGRAGVLACTEFPSPEDGTLPSAVPGMPGARNTIYKSCETKNLSKPFPRPTESKPKLGAGRGRCRTTRNQGWGV